MEEKPNILVVCGRNKKRSRTAEYIFKNDSRFNIRSVGLSPRSERQIRESDLNWSDYILVMEEEQSKRIKKQFRHTVIPDIEVLLVEDEFEYLQPELMHNLRHKINAIMELQFDL